MSRDESSTAGELYFKKLFEDLISLNDIAATYINAYNSIKIKNSGLSSPTFSLKAHFKESKEALQLATSSYKTLISGLLPLFEEKGGTTFKEKYEKLKEYNLKIISADIPSIEDAENFSEIANQIVVMHIFRDVFSRVR